MTPRTEDQILSKAPFRAKLGNGEYDIAPLPMLKASKWRAMYFDKIKNATKGFSTAADSDSVGAGLAQALLGFPEVLWELVLAYAPNLPKAEIEETVTDEQIVHCFSAIMSLAFPYWSQLKAAVTLAKDNTLTN